MRRVLAIVPMVILGLSGCATMQNQSTGPVIVHSDKPGYVLLNGRVVDVVGATPGILLEPEGRIEVQARGCRPYVVEVERAMSGWFYANLLMFGMAPVGMIVDAANGSMWKYSPAEVRAICQTERNPGSPGGLDPG